MHRASAPTERSSLLTSTSVERSYHSVKYTKDEISISVQFNRSLCAATATAYITEEDYNYDRKTSYRSWTKQQWLVLIIQNSLILTSCVAYPLLSTFFPQEADKKGVSSFIIGLIFGVYEFVIFFMAPIFGALVCISI